jgi:hypothetical protein
VSERRQETASAERQTCRYAKDRFFQECIPRGKSVSSRAARAER